MNIALIGAHGVGKTTVLERMKVLRPDMIFFDENVRRLTKIFGMSTPFNIIEQYGTGVLALASLNASSVADPEMNNTLDLQRHSISDRGGVDQLAYFLSFREKLLDIILEPLIRAAAKHRVGLVDVFVYFPIGVFPLVGDEMRPAEIDVQRRVDDAIHQALRELEIPPKCVHYLQAVEVEERVQEIIALLPKKEEVGKSQ